MLSNVGHTIQKIINNTPIAVTVNEKTTVVATNGGNVYQSGLIGGKIQNTFNEVFTNENIVGQVVDVEATENEIYFLNASGSVFEYDYNAGDCSPIVREVYSPAACGGDKAVRIVSGRAHVLILTQNNKVWGAGDNSEYQLVPQGQCKYDTAVEIVVTDTNLHDNECCTSFTGVFNELTHPVIPSCEKECNKVTCVKDILCDTLIGYLNIRKAEVTPPGHHGTLSIPVYGNVNYVGFLCVDSNGCASGTLTYNITKLYIKCGCFISKFTNKDSCGCHIRELNTSSTNEIILFESEQCQFANTDTCGKGGVAPLTGTVQINGKCGSCVVVNVDLQCKLDLPNVSYDPDCKTIVLTLCECKTTLTALCDHSFDDLCSDAHVKLDLDFDVPLDCCEPCKPIKSVVELPQPCWTNIYAGHDVSVLVDSCNRLYVLGSLHKVRSNRDLLKRTCLEDLLGKTNASISFPADQLNCSGRTIKNDNCRCNKCQEKTFKTDLSKFGIHLNFPNEDTCRSMNVCDFIQKLQHCNEVETCNPTCEPCDGYIYLNIADECGCPCGAPSSSPIGSITIFNRKSICKMVSQGSPDLIHLSADFESIVEYDLNKYCIDAVDVALDKVVKLNFCTDGPNVNIYLDVDQPGGIKFTAGGKKCNVEFSVNSSTDRHQFILNYGSILDPVELTNLKYALSLDCFFPCPKYKNPFDTKITNTYLKGGDRVRFVVGNPKNVRQALTPDVPTVFRLSRRVLDVAVGFNNLTVLVGGLACPNELFVIGNNCHGELGLGTYESVVCWKQLNRCQFDCQVSNVFAGKYVTFYVTQSQHVYASGQWKCFVNSTTPVIIKSICQSWKIRQISIAKNHIALLGSDGCIFGLGDNSLGELGLGHLECVLKPTPLVFFYKLNNCVVKQLRNNLTHPVEANHRKCRPCDGDGPYEYDEPIRPRCGTCKVEPCECNVVKYYKSPKCGFSRKYLPNARVYVNKGYKY